MKKFLIVILSILFVGCTHFLYEELAHIEKGMTTAEVKNIVVDSEYGVGIDLHNDDISEDLYTKGNLSYLIAEKYTPMEFEHYVFIFSNGKLVYWGSPYQVANHSDSEISELSVDISKTILEKY